MWHSNAVILILGLNPSFKVFQETLLNIFTTKCLVPHIHPGNHTHLLSILQACSSIPRLRQTMTSQICQGKHASPWLACWVLSLGFLHIRNSERASSVIIPWGNNVNGSISLWLFRTTLNYYVDLPTVSSLWEVLISSSCILAVLKNLDCLPLFLWKLYEVLECACWPKNLGEMGCKVCSGSLDNRAIRNQTGVGVDVY